MRVMVIVKASKDSEAGIMPSEQLLNEMGKFNEELVKAGMMLAGDGLHPSSKGKRVWFSGKNRTVIDGPFSETKELIAGFWIWKVGSMQEAVEWVKRCPNPMLEDSEIEIRPLFELEDFGDAATPEVREREERLRKEIESGALAPQRWEDAPEKLIVGLNDTYTFESRVKIPEQWNRFVPHLGRVPGQMGKVCYGVCWNYKPGQGFDYLTGVEVANSSGLPAEFTSVRLPGGRYAVFVHSGHVSSIPQTIEAVWTKWLPTSGFQATHSPCFERYTEEFNPHTGLGGMELWIPIQS